MAHHPTHLRVEHLDDAVLGTHERRSRRSWWLPAGSRSQIAYRIRTQTWDSGRVESDSCVLEAFARPEPQPGERITSQVKVWTDRGESDWSAPACWETSIIGTYSTARWIEPHEAEVPPAGRRPPTCFAVSSRTWPGSQAVLSDLPVVRPRVSSRSAGSTGRTTSTRVP
ncbi:glycoside hydrolase family 78 protein [Streptomyces sp. NPDC055681]